MSASNPHLVDMPVPASAGIGLKSCHFEEILDTRPDVGWFEVHTENYMGEGGLAHYFLEWIRERYPLSMHGVGLSLGSAAGLDPDHVERVRRAVDRYRPDLVSEHVSFSTVDGKFLNDLLPLPYTEEALDIICRNIDHLQETLGRPILVENPSTYLEYNLSKISEPEFLNEVCRRTGCGLLLDINNIYVSCWNCGGDAAAYIRQITPRHVGEYHLAGHAEKKWQDRIIRIDDHGSNVCGRVWQLYDLALDCIGARPTLVEWDCNIPSLMTLLQEAGRAENALAGREAAQ
ncbi:DUF692 domain-containing protein [Emcibacter nanhaiensis]|uniref:DUF692 domain-containing protein n=2 Tax=Emcibacter nanhaiensis TaxID=1505037 RepID=A0A501PTE2_9PROT|nr:DUF692 domain-containing protein [Emcibacter nanhaiensis]